MRSDSANWPQKPVSRSGEMEFSLERGRVGTILARRGFRAGGGHRTHTPLSGPRILSPVRLPVPPPRHVVQCVELTDSTVEGGSSDLERILKAVHRPAVQPLF